MEGEMIRRKLLALVVLLALVSTMSAATIPAGTPVSVRIGTSLNSGANHTGDTWEGTLAKDVVVGGRTIAKRGDPVKGKVTLAKSSGRLHAPGQLSLRLTSINGEVVSSTRVGRTGKGHMKSNATKIGGGAAAGAVIGAIAGGGKGAAIGTLAGGAAGTGVAAYTGKEEAVIGTESVLSFTTTGTSASARRR